MAGVRAGWEGLDAHDPYRRCDANLGLSGWERRIHRRDQGSRCHRDRVHAALGEATLDIEWLPIQSRARIGIDVGLEIEITESVLLEQAAENQTFIAKLKNAGISLALDDFGTGYSSLSYLTNFPFDKIKVDKSFIHKLTEQPESAAIISSIVTLARGMQMSVTAEGVETLEQLETLRTLGVNFAQGYLLGRPVPLAELEGRPHVNAYCLNAA